MNPSQTHDAKVLEIVNTEEAMVKAVSDAKEIFKYRFTSSLDKDDDSEDLDVENIGAPSQEDMRQTRSITALGEGSLLPCLNHPEISG
jgi:hypothetical protein